MKYHSREFVRCRFGPDHNNCTLYAHIKTTECLCACAFWEDVHYLLFPRFLIILFYFKFIER